MLHTCLAEACGHAGHVDEGLSWLAEAQMKTSDERWWEAAINRHRGELLLIQPGRQADAEAAMQHALTVARLWQQQGKRAAAHDLLAPVYAWFTEGFDTPDLREARALLETLT